MAEHAGQCSASNILAPDIFTTGTIAGPGTSLFVFGSIDGYHCNIMLIQAVTYLLYTQTSSARKGEPAASNFIISGL